MRSPPLPISAAHAELLRKSGELDDLIAGRGLVFDDPPPPQAPPPVPFIIERPDWDQEARELAAREQDEREAEFQAELERRLESEAAEPPARPTPPAPKPSKWRRNAA